MNRRSPLAGARSLAGRARQAATAPPAVWRELVRERTAAAPASEDHGPHLEAAIDWLVRAQDATPDDGIARGYSLARHVSFRTLGWQPSYPETTGYIIPTFYAAAEALGRPDLAERAERAARWEVETQLATGAVRGGVIGEGDSPAVFNTGQVLFGWLAAHAVTGDEVFADAARRAAGWLVTVQGRGGLWNKGNSRFARRDSTLYNARAAWGLAEAGVRLGESRFREAAAHNLRAVASLQHANGWFPRCCLTDPERPLLHTLAYTIRGLLEGGRLLHDETLVAAAVRAAEPLALAVHPDGRLAGRFTDDWRPAARWSCLTGQVQIAGVWLILHDMTGDERWLPPALASIRFVKRSQSLSSADPGLRGGIRGSVPMTGEYGRFEVLNWATKFFVDALLRDRLRVAPSPAVSSHLALA